MHASSLKKNLQRKEERKLERNKERKKSENKRKASCFTEKNRDPVSDNNICIVCFKTFEDISIAGLENNGNNGLSAYIATAGHTMIVPPGYSVYVCHHCEID